MEEEVEDIVPCTSLVVDSLLRVRTVGAIWGLCAGPHKARKRGLTGIAQASHVGKQHGYIGVSLYAFGPVPLTNSIEDVITTERAYDFFLGWAANPLVFGDYPITKKKNVGSRLPIFSNRESKLVKGSFDFLGIVHIGGRRAIHHWKTCQGWNTYMHTLGACLML
ncbi:hypothetical protein QYF36_020236 [Acer negundo]|nr:hypothetical protein QYF36_020236 [Acer negundo]